jgi:hypothetical protein
MPESSIINDYLLNLGDQWNANQVIKLSFSGGPKRFWHFFTNICLEILLFII